MKTKLEMAHEWYMMQIRRNGCALVADAWKYADAMQAEADKRENKETCDKSLNIDSKELNVEEWQPDWSKAPDWAVAWTIDSAECLWWSYIPWFKNNFWFVDDPISWKCDDAPNFGYKGDWRDSLRKRPQ